MPRLARPEKGVYERVPGSGIWYARFIHKGRKTVQSFGKDRQAAVAYIRDVQAKKRIAPHEVHPQPKAVQTTIGMLCDDLLQHIRSQPDEYRDQKTPPARIELIRAAFGERVADSIRPHEISTWLLSMKKRTRGVRNGSSRQTDQPISGGTSNRLKSTFSSLYQRGKHHDKVHTNPVRDVKQRRTGGGIVRFLLPDEENRLRAVLQAKVNACSPQQPKLRQQALHRIYELDVALGTGMRKGEQYGLQWKDVDFDREVITLHDTKNGTAREVHMIADVVAAMKALRGMSDDLHTSQPGCVFRNGENKKWWLAMLKEAKIENLRWHDLRHTFCSRLAQSGASLKIIQEAAGHKTIQMSARYAHMDKSSLANAMAVLNRKLTHSA